MNLGEVVPNFAFHATSSLIASSSDYLGKYLILYFYPKDATPGCTIEGQDFRDSYSKFVDEGAQIFGVSRDSMKSHEKFKASEQFPFELISDTDEILCNLFDVIKMKSMYGKQVRGIERSTFIIDKQGRLTHEWRKIKIKGHVDEVLLTLKNLKLNTI